MKQKDLLFISIAVFLTMVAFVIITIYHIQEDPYINREIKDVVIPTIILDRQVFPILKNRPE